MHLIKRMAAKLPGDWQLALRRRMYARQIRRNAFRTSEPEYDRLGEWIREGDWVLDIGANIGHYTKRFSELAGASGRVLAFEPVPDTFALLTANVRLFAHANVSLFNAAVSDRLDLSGMMVPEFETGLRNYYEARLADAASAAFSVLTLPVDRLAIEARVALVKIDAEDHEAAVLAGMSRLLEKHHPVLIVETGDEEVVKRLAGLGYGSERLPGSPNILFRPK